MKKYAIVTGTSIDSLSDLINETLKDGWEPLGAPFLATEKLGDQLYRQAIILHGAKNPPHNTPAEVRGGKWPKSLAQIAYEADPNGGQQNFGPWENVSPLVKSIHWNMAEAVKREVLSQLEFLLNGQKLRDME